jgi:transposase-like protein
MAKVATTTTIINRHNRYVNGEKYCKWCALWIKDGFEVYNGNNNSVRPRCPQCNKFLRTRPPNAKSKDKLMKITTGKGLTRY